MNSSANDLAIIGGGIVGLATALSTLRRFAPLRLIVLEKESEVARHQTGHNSGVVHSGIYYRPGSQKAHLCVEGGRQLAQFCEEHGIRIERCGKVIVATEERELPRLAELLERGRANGVEGLVRISADRLRDLEPHATGLAAIYVPKAGIVDFAEVARAIAHEVQHRGGEIALNVAVVAIQRTADGFHVQTTRDEVHAKYLINCAGLHADQIAQLAGSRPTARIVPFRGEYYLLRPERRHLVRGLIYPVPDPNFPFLGVHFARTVHGEVAAGPNAVLAFAREGYTLGRIDPPELFATLAYRGFWRMARRYWATGLAEFHRSVSKSAFMAALRRLVPDLRDGDVIRNGAGVRAQAVSPEGLLVDDFHIVDGSGAIHVLNAPSPAATAALAIGAHLATLAASSFALAART